MNNSGLGRGLSSLIPSKKNQTVVASMSKIDSVVEDILDDKERISNLSVEKISPNPHQPRNIFNEEDLNDLVESIRQHGIIQPIIVTKKGSDWQLIAGERRWRSAKKIGLKTIPAIVREIDDQKKLEIALIENLQRKDLNALEIAAAYQKLVDDFNLTQEQLAKRVGKSRSAVANTMRLLTATEDVQIALQSGRISEGHARVLVGLPEDEQIKVLREIIKRNLSVRETEKSGREIVSQKNIRKIKTDPELKAKEEKLQKILGTKVEIKRMGDGCQVIIKLFSNEELQSLINRIV